MGEFSEEILLTNATGSRLYHSYAENLPILDFHCHLSPQAIAEDVPFTDLGQIWLEGDHYKWRAMRTFGIPEELITGNKTDFHEKFLAYAGIAPYLVGNPLWLWNQLELKRFFNIGTPLNPDTAEDIYQATRDQIVERRISPRSCIRESGVELLSTTEDPIDDLRWHTQIAESGFETRVLSAFRPDRAIYIEKPDFGEYLETLQQVSGVSINSFEDLVGALAARLKFFAESGTMVSDCGINELFWTPADSATLDRILNKARAGVALSFDEVHAWRSCLLVKLGELFTDNGFVMQLHIGGYRDANSVGVARIGKDAGFDCTDDRTSVHSVGQLLDTLNRSGKLPKTILYPLDPTKFEVFAVLAAGFCDDGTRGKVQLGAPWWFNDQDQGIRRQFESCGQLYPVSLSVGMLTDSRSFFSYPRFEVHRRVLCDYLGSIVERGAFFDDESYLARIINDVCYANAKEFFGF